MLDKISFTSFVSHPQNLTLNDIMLLENTTKKYPYFQLAYSLIAKGIYTKAPEIANDAIRKAALYALSRNALRKLIENEIDWTTTSIGKLVDIPSEAKLPQDTIEEEMKREQLEDELLEAIAKPANKSLQDQQLKIIENFIKNEPRISPIKSPNNPEEIADLSETSTSLKGPLVTESYAKILAKQGRFDKSIEVYQNLFAKNPEKRAYFAEKIEELQKKTL